MGRQSATPRLPPWPIMGKEWKLPFQPYGECGLAIYRCKPKKQVPPPSPPPPPPPPNSRPIYIEFG